MCLMKRELSFIQYIMLPMKKGVTNETVLQIRRAKGDNLGIIFHITPLKRML